MFAKTFGCVRFIYNKMLGDRLDYYKETGKKLNNTPAQYKEDFPWLKEIDSLALANAQMNLNKAYNNFFRNRKHFGKPHFKSKKTGHGSYSTNNQKGSVRLEGNKVKICYNKNIALVSRRCYSLICLQYDISFIILTWNSMAYIEKCIKSIDAVHSLKIKMYVVDNGSTDGTIQFLYTLRKKQLHTELEVIPLPKNMGTTVSRNLGMKKAYKESRYLCILDSDTEVNEEALQHLVQTLKSDTEIGIVGPVMKGLDGTIQNSGRGIPTLKLKLFKVMPFESLRRKGEQMEIIPKKQDVTNVGYLMSACWMFPAKLVEQIGFLDERIFYAPEDVEYCMRVWKNGYRVCYDKNAVIIHAWQRLSRKKIFSKLNWEHIKGLLYLFHQYGCYCKRPDYVKY